MGAFPVSTLLETHHRRNRHISSLGPGLIAALTDRLTAVSSKPKQKIARAGLEGRGDLTVRFA